MHLSASSDATWEKIVVNQTDVRCSELLKICISLQDQASYQKRVLPREIEVYFLLFQVDYSQCNDTNSPFLFAVSASISRENI